MKKLLFSLLAVAALTTAQAQTSVAETTKPSLTKEEKAKQKAQKEQDLTDALDKLGLSDEQKKGIREALETSTKKSNELKAKMELTEEARAEEKKKISDEKNARLKELMGKDKYKEWNAVRKEQAAKTAVANQ